MKPPVWATLRQPCCRFSIATLGVCEVIVGAVCGCTDCALCKPINSGYIGVGAAGARQLNVFTGGTGRGWEPKCAAVAMSGEAVVQKNC